MFKSISNCISIMILSLVVFGCSSSTKTSQTEDYQEFVYDFDNNSTSDWYGPANTNIVNGQLHLSSIQGYIWRSISNIYDTSFIEGNLDLDIYLSEGSYLSIETKGQLKNSFSDDWGMFSLFSKDSVFNVKQVNNQPKLYYTNYIYNNNTWYHLRYTFNCDEGKYGNYEVWIKKEDEDEKYLGKYDYRNGPLNGIHTFALSLGDQQLLRTKQVIIDNIIFKFKR